MKYEVKNFTGRDVLDVRARCYEGRPFVGLICDAGSLRFQHDMTPDGAREMAKYLIASALDAESMLDAVAISNEVSA